MTLALLVSVGIVIVKPYFAYAYALGMRTELFDCVQIGKGAMRKLGGVQTDGEIYAVVPLGNFFALFGRGRVEPDGNDFVDAVFKAVVYELFDRPIIFEI